MSQTGYTPILIYSSSTGGNTPAAGNLTNSTLGSELAINITDGKLFYKDNANNIQVIGWKTVPATAGGTGQTSYAVGDILYASSTTALSKLADVATGNALISGGVGVAPSWGKIGLTTHVSGVLPVANGGTNSSSASITAFNNITGYTASGATGTTSTNLVFSTSPSITTATLVGDSTMSTGNLIQGTAAKGINFTANSAAAGMTSQLLNWYEEGTWTPVIGGDGGTSGQSYSTQNGKYVKVGKLVTVSCDVRLSAKGTITGNVILSGLPFTVTSGDYYGGGTANLFQNLGAATSMVAFHAIPNSTTAYAQKSNNNTSSAYMATADITNTTWFFITMSYIST